MSAAPPPEDRLPDDAVLDDDTPGGELVGTGSGGITFQAQEFAFGQRVGVRTDSQSTQVIQQAIDALCKVPGDLPSILQTLFGSTSDKQLFGYDPSVDWLVGISLTYSVLTFDVLLVDGQFYGLLIKIVKKPPPSKADEQPFAGLTLEILYRKINDHLGEFSVDLTLPTKYRKIKLGEPPGATVITLPAVGLSIWTNGDFKVSIGWPLGERSFNITFPPDPIPWAGGGGLYFAKLRSEDGTGLGTNFSTIIEFGIGLRIGAASEGDASIVKYNASLYLFGSFQGFLAWETGHPISGGVDYYWFCATVGIQGHLEGVVDFVIIKVTLSLDITASATLALETSHSTTAQVEFKASVKASVKILFFSVSFSFTLDLQTQIQFGSGPPSKITGPSPPTTLPATATATRSIAGGLPAPAQRQQAALRATPGELEAAVTVPLTLKAHLLLQPTVRQDPTSGAWKAAGVATLVLERPPAEGAGLGLGTDPFSQLAASLAGRLFATCSTYSNPTQPLTKAQIEEVLTALESGRFELQAIYAWMQAAEISFAIAGAKSGETGEVQAALLPMVPGLQLAYAGASTTFGDASPPPGYLTELADYFAKLSLVGEGKLSGTGVREAAAAAIAPPSAAWFPGLLFADAYNLLGKQIVKEIAALAAPGTLEGALAQLDVANLAGTLSRFLQHGQRLPDPSASGPVETLPTLALHELTGQQFDVAEDSTHNPILTAQLSAPSPRVTVTIEGDGSAALPFALTQAPEQGPLCSAQPLARIEQVPVAYLLRTGFPWAQQTSTATNQWLLFDFPEQLQSTLRLRSPLQLTLAATSGSGAPTPVRGTQGLMIRFALSPVPSAGATDKLAGKVFKVAGPDEATRDLIELLLASGEMASVQLDLLLPGASSGSYKTGPADAEALLFKTDLSTVGGPTLSALFEDALQERFGATAVPALGPTSAPLSSPTEFLRLLWECSIVHSAGFFLYVPDLDTSSGARSYEVAVLASAAGAPSATLAIDSHHTTILAAAADVASNQRLEARLFESDGTTPVTEPKPAYPPGTIAFGTSWTASDSPPVPAAAVAADSAEYAAALYQLLEFRLPGDAVVEASAWSMPLGPDGDEHIWSYRRAVPVQRFVKGAAPTPNRYGAIGHATQLELRLLDVFGNATALPPLTATPVYNDPLIALDEWPGAAVTYAFEQASAGTATLKLEVAFDPEEVEHAESALPYYQTIHDQLTDTRTHLTVTTALASGPLALSTAGGEAVQPALAAFVAQIIAHLQPTSPGPAPGPVLLSGAVQCSYVSQISEDMFPLWVTVELARDTPPESPSYDYPSGFLQCATQISLRLNPESSSPEAALREWAEGFEAAFADFDSAGALLKVLAGSPPSKVSASASRLGASVPAEVTSMPGDVWAMRWSPSVGVSVRFPNAAGQAEAAPVYFSAMPLSTQLLAGTVEIYGYDNSGNREPQPTPTTFSSVDLDGWASAFLSAFDALLAPDLAAAIARLSPGDYGKLMNAKEEVAYAIAAGASWVFEDQMPGDGAGNLEASDGAGNLEASDGAGDLEASDGAGDLEAAQLCLRESLLSALSADFATSAIVQVPAAVAVNGPFEAGSAPARAPELFGSPTPIQPKGETTLEQYTISSATLPVVAGDTQLTFLVGAANPTTQADLKLSFAYDIAYLDHAFQTSEEQFGYVPSSWLRFVVPSADPGKLQPPALDVAMGQLDIPIPLRAYPAPPRLVREAAIAAHPAPQTLAEAVAFGYQLTISSPSVAQDDLHLSVLFNGATVERPAGVGPAEPLFGPLARFQDFQAHYLPTAVQAIEGAEASAVQWCADIVSLVQEVATAWQGSEGTERFAAGEPAQVPPKPWKWELRLQVPDETKPEQLVLDWTGEGTPPAEAWPTIEGVSGVAEGPTRMLYTLAASANLTEPTLAWPGLSAITAQRITTAAWIVRNETLAGQQRTTNPALVYSTATVTFPDPVIPLLQVAEPLELKAASLGEALEQLVDGAMQPTTPEAQVGWGLETGYEFALLSGSQGEVRTRLPSFLAHTQLTTAPTPPPEVDSPASLKAALEKQLREWHAASQLSGSAAALVFALTIFAAGGEQPLVRVLEVRAPISGPGWWPS